MRRKSFESGRLHLLASRASLVLSVALVFSALFLFSTAGPSVARAASVVSEGSQKVAAFEDVTIAAGETRENLVVIGGDVVIHGTVENVVVVVGGDVLVTAEGRVGAGLGRSSGDAAIVSVFGDVVIEPGAAVSGRVVDVGAGGAGIVDAIVVDPVQRPWNDWASIAGWIGSTVFILLVAVLIAAIAPRQLAFVAERARRHLFSSLGWGALGLIILVPLISILLIVTIVGILVLLPWWLVVIVTLLFGYVGVGTLIGRLVLGRGEGRGRVILAAVLGVAVLCIVRWIPFFGSVVVFFALLIGFGATFTAVFEWRRRKKAAERAARSQYQPGAPYGQPPAGGPEPRQAPWERPPD